MNYVIDDFGRSINVTGTDVGTVTRHYDEHGWLVEERLADATRTAYTYDRAGRVTNVDYDADHPTAFADRTRYYYDSIPSPQSCPSTGLCTNLAGRLAMSENDSVSPTYRQFYGYDSAGHTTLLASQIASSSWWRSTRMIRRGGLRISCTRLVPETRHTTRTI